MGQFIMTIPTLETTSEYILLDSTTEATKGTHSIVQPVMKDLFEINYLLTVSSHLTVTQVFGLSVFV